MRTAHITGSIGLAAALFAGIGALRATTPHATSATPVRTQLAAVPPRTWHVIAGFTQAIPTGNGNTEMVNQFYPRNLTIYQGDSVTWTINAHNVAHTVTFGPDALLRKLENPQNQALPQVVDGRRVLVANPAVIFPSTRGPLVETDTGSARHLLNCGMIGPIGAPAPQSCTVTFPNAGTFAYDCLFHSGIPGNEDMDGTVTVIPRPRPLSHRWTVWAGTGTATDEESGFFPQNLTIHIGDTVTWKSGGEHFHTVSFGIDPVKTPLIVPAGKDAHGAPILAFNALVFNPHVPRDGIYMGGIASSGIFGLGGNYANLPGQVFLRRPFTLTFGRPGVYTYYCLVHGPLMKGTITVLPVGQSQ